LFLPNKIRQIQYVIRAFNVETSRVKDSVSNPLIGKMRFQFWRETIDKVFEVQNLFYFPF